jgi:hypothetical protein
MGMEIIHLGKDHGSSGSTINLRIQDLSPISFSTHSVAKPPMSIWLMSAAPHQPVFPWWAYSANLDEAVSKLNEIWSITNAQSFFDCLYLSQLKKQFPSNLYVIFPGNIRVDGWSGLKESSQNTFLRGQECIYHLEAAFSSKLSINWVPFSQPQRIVKDPSFGDLWRLYQASRADDVAMSLSFFSLSNPATLPEAIQLLIHPNENRSEEFSKNVDWFGAYSSPLRPDYASCSVVYSRHADGLGPITQFEKRFNDLIQQVRSLLVPTTTPEAVFRILSRLVAI